MRNARASKSNRCMKPRTPPGQMTTFAGRPPHTSVSARSSGLSLMTALWRRAPRDAVLVFVNEMTPGKPASLS